MPHPDTSPTGSARRYRVTTADRPTDAVGREWEGTWDQLLEALTPEEVGEKRSQWWSPSTFEGGLRRNETWQGSDLLVLDLDGDWDRAALDQTMAEHRAALLPSYSWAPEQEKYRLIIPLAERCTDPATYRATTRAWAERLGADPSATDPARCFFFGTRPALGPKRPTPRLGEGDGLVATVQEGAASPRDRAQEVVEVEFRDLDPAEIPDLLGRTGEEKWPALREHQDEGLWPNESGRHDHGIKLISELCLAFPDASPESIQEYLQPWVASWLDGAEPMFWSHLNKCAYEPSRLSAAADLQWELDPGLFAPPAPDVPEPDGWLDWEDEPAPIEWLLEELHLAPGRISMIAGKGSTGKTTAAMDMAVCLAAGLPVWGIAAAARPLRVAWIDYEMGDGSCRRKLIKAWKAHGRPADAKLRLVTDAPQFGVGRDGTRVDPFPAWLGALVEQDQLDVVFLDNLQAGSDGEENSATVRKPLDEIRKALGDRCTAILLHHQRKSSADDARDGISGHAALYNALGACFTFSREADAGPDDPTVVRRVKSHAEAEQFGHGRFGLTLAGDTLMYAELAEEEEPKKRDLVKEIEAVLQDQNLNAGMVAYHIDDVELEAVNKTLRQMDKAGMVRETNGAWSLTSQFRSLKDDP